LVELIKVRQLYLELQSGSATLAPRQRNEDTGLSPSCSAACSESPRNTLR